MKIAVIADPHYHDTASWPGRDGPAFRSFADSIASTRVFNESGPALRALLDDIVRRGISLVIIAGDLSDDGQRATMAKTVALLEDYTRRHGLRFLATPGNHDLYAIHGRHHGKRFLNEDGSHVLVTSDAAAPQGSSVARLVTEDMYCGGYARALADMAAFGFFRQAADRHWESPFGDEDDLARRSFIIRSADGATERRMIDASYLVEPVDGLWVLSLDANVFEPRNGDLDPAAETSYHDSTSAGWNAMLRHKPFILDWMRDVARRARERRKRLIVFSHYPMINPSNGALADEIGLFGNNESLRRVPVRAVAEAAAATGIKVHFGGHLHVNHTAVFHDAGDFLVNVAVPSMVAFPPAYKLVEVAAERLAVETVMIDDVPGFDTAFPFYRAEADCEELTAARNHADFLDRHLALLVRERYLPKEWPEDLARLAPLLSLDELDRLAGEASSLLAEEIGSRAPDGQLTFLDMITDWYRLRKANSLALDFIAPERLARYRALVRRYRAGKAWLPGSLQARLTKFMRLMDASLDGNPSADFAIDLRDGAVEDLAAYLGRTERRQTGGA
ncbi:MAG: metallophosphoesterase family protein [Pseudomonadota bacterium]